MMLRSATSRLRRSWRATATVDVLGSRRALSSAHPLPLEEDDKEEENRRLASLLWKKRQQNIERIPTRRPGSSTMAAAQDAQATAEQTLYPKENEVTEADNSSVPPTSLSYTGNVTIPITTRLNLVTPDQDAPRGIWPVFRLMDETGDFREPEYDALLKHDDAAKEVTRKDTPSFKNETSRQKDDLNALRNFLCQTHPVHAEELEASALLRDAKHPYPDTESTNTLMRAFTQMIRLRTMDDILLNAQRQGRISFYMTCRGEEAIHFGAASALDLNDVLLTQYREQGTLMWRGFTLEQFMNQCFSNEGDLGKGRQMPVHYGSRALNFHTVSSPLGTQLPHAVGVGYRLKLQGTKGVAVCFFGEGCASTTDFHSALNFAATLKTPTVFVCRNNGYAISTSIEDQYAGDGIITRAPGYGMAGLRVDGNDLFAMHAAMRHAKEYALNNQAPVLIEAMSYRQGHHSTSDDSTRYRAATEVQAFADEHDPLTRFSNFLKRHGLVTEAEQATIQDEEKMAVLKAMEQAEKKAPPRLESLFQDVYHEMPPHLLEQQAQLQAHMAKYPNKYK